MTPTIAADTQRITHAAPTGLCLPHPRSEGAALFFLLFLQITDAWLRSLCTDYHSTGYPKVFSAPYTRYRNPSGSQCSSYRADMSCVPEAILPLAYTHIA